jgi:broad specificity phosphatase PhoE
MAALTRDPDKLFAEASLSIRPELIERIRKLRNEVAAYQQTNTAVIPTHSGLIAALPDLLLGPADMSSILAKMNGTISRDELLKKLLHLHERGVVRLVIDLPERGNA